ncbi:hypothetical protein J2Z45_003417 [Cohnella lubricantis]|nr:hypothetical protein [Cohnella lubricantis]
MMREGEGAQGEGAQVRRSRAGGVQWLMVRELMVWELDGTVVDRAVDSLVAFVHLDSLSRSDSIS